MQFIMAQSPIQNNKRIAKNTILLYFRMIISMLVSLYTSRVILNVLGVEDYGIYNVVGGIVSMLGFLNGSMTTTTQRYITFELGRGDYPKLKLVFNTCRLILGGLSILIVLVAETIGLWFFYTQMQIPVDRMDAAFGVYQCSILTTVISVMSVPYNAAIIAHEKMSAFAYISIFEVSLKLIIVYMLLWSSMDKLILYAILVVGVQLLIRIIYSLYCNRHFEETKLIFVFDKPLMKEMFSFTGWNLFGNIASVGMSSGVNILLNMFFGPLVNAARGISGQVQGAILQFSVNFQVALNPQITKLYAVGEYTAMNKLIERSCKLTFFLLLFLCLPVMLETDLILSVWLKDVPEYTVVFTRILLISSLIDPVAGPLMVSAAATGNVRLYQSVVGGILLAILPLSYFVLKLGGSPSSVLIVQIIVSVIAFIARLYIVSSMIQLKIRNFVRNVVFRCLYVAGIAVPLPVILKEYMEDGWLSFCLVCLLSVFTVLVSSFFFGLDVGEKIFIKNKVLVILEKIRK